MPSKYYTSALTKVAGSSTQFTADIYLADASNVGAYGVELVINGEPAGVSYSYTAATVIGFNATAGVGISAMFTASNTVGGTIAAAGALIGTITVSFATAPSAPFKLAVLYANLDDIYGSAMTVSWDAFATYDPNTGNPPADTTPPVAPTLSLASDTGTNTGDGITSSGVVNVTGLESGATWQFSTNGGSTWSAGTGTNFTLSGDGAKSVTVRQTDAAGNVGAASTALAFTLDSAAPTLASASPSDNASAVAVGNNIFLTFSESVAVGTGNIVISNGADTRTISVTDASQVTLSGTQVTINPTADLLAGSSYNVQMVSGVIRDAVGNAFVGIADPTTLNFAVQSASPPSTSVPRYSVTALTKVGNSNTQFSADVYLSNASNVSVYLVELQVDGNPSGVSYVYAASPVSGFGVAGGTAIGGVSDIGRSFGESGTKIGSVTVTFAVAPTASFKLTPSFTALIDANNVMVSASWDAFALFDPNADTTPPVAPTLSLNDTGVMGTDGITKIGALNVVGLESGATWQYSTNGGGSWLAGSGTSITLSGDGAKSVTVRQTDAAGNVGAASSALSFTLDTVSSTPVINAVATDNIVNATEKAAGVTVSGTAETGSSVAVSWGAVSKTVAAPGGNWSTSFSSAEVPANAASTTVSAVATDIAGNASAAGTKAVVVDAAAPTLSSASPSDNASAVAVGNNIVLTFNESVSLGTGNIVISNGADARTISIADASQVTLSGTQVTINPTADLLAGSSYNVQMASGVIKDLSGNVFAGIADATTLNFGTAGPSGGTGQTLDVMAYTWKNHTLLSGVTVTAGSTTKVTGVDGSVSLSGITDANVALQVTRAVPSGEATQTVQAVNLQDAIAILKMIVGLDVNGAGKALSPYQALAADYDGNGAVQLTDAIGVLKHVVGLTAPQPAWHFANEGDVLVPLKANLTPGAAPAISVAVGAGSSPVHVGLVAYLSGDVDGSFAGAAGSLDLDTLQSNYFNNLTSSQGLNPSQFGVYSV